jgi:outer membrane protein TolC
MAALLLIASPSYSADVYTTPLNLDESVTNKIEVYKPKQEAFTFADCYELALRQSELIAISGEEIRVTEAWFLQAMSIMMPYFSWQSTHMQEETPDDKGSTFGSLKPAKYSESNFYVTQNLFTGFKAFAAMKGSNFEKRQRTEERARAEQLLLVDVANAFYLLQEKKEDLKAVLRIRKALRERVAELMAREDIGRSRTSEVVNAKTQLYSVEADIKLVKSQQLLAGQLLGFLVGRPVTAIDDTFRIPEGPKDENYYVVKFLQRPDIKAAGYAWQVSRKELDMINSDFLPTVSWSGNWYTQRTGFDKGTDWDITLNVDVPIFNGTDTLGKSKQYKLKAHERELEYARLKRKAPFDIKDAYVKFSTAVDIQINLKKAYSTAKVNYYLQRKDYSRSLVSNLEVLASIQTLQNSQRDYIRAVYEAKRLYWALRVSAGDDVREAINDSF